MKKLLILLLLLISTTSFAQSVVKLRANSFCEKHTVNTQWTEFTSWKDTNILIVIDGDKQRITVYSAQTQTYDIITNDGLSLSEFGERTQNYTCVDENGAQCGMRVIERSQSTNIIFDFSNIIICYNVSQI